MSDPASRQEKPGTPDHGPTEAPPNLPRGWIAQWDAKAGKYYFVQLSTSYAQWELPTEAAPGVDTPSGTPMSGTTSQFPRPVTSPEDGKRNAEAARGIDDNKEGERGLGSMALNMLAGKQGHGNNHQTNLTGLAHTFLSGQGSHGHSNASNTGGAGAIAANLLSSAFSSINKPHSQPSSGHQSSSGYGTSSTPQSSGHSMGAGGMLNNFISGHESHHQGPQYGYSSTPNPGGYSGTAPAAQYRPNPPQQQPYNPQASQFGPTSYQSQSNHNQPVPTGPNAGQYSEAQAGHHHGGIQRPEDPSKPFYVGGTPFDDPNSGYAGAQHHQVNQGNYGSGQYGNHQQNQYSGPNSIGYDGRPQPGRAGNYGQPGSYANQGQQFPPPSNGAYGGHSGGSYNGPPRY